MGRPEFQGRFAVYLYFPYFERTAMALISTLVILLLIVLVAIDGDGPKDAEK